jgi:hypothetical protein
MFYVDAHVPGCMSLVPKCMHASHLHSFPCSGLLGTRFPLYPFMNSRFPVLCFVLHSIPVAVLSHPVFKAKTRCSSYICPESSCHTYGHNVSTEYQCLYYIVSYYKNLLQVQKGLNSGMDPFLPQAVDRGFHTLRRNLHQCTPHPLSGRT